MVNNFEQLSKLLLYGPNQFYFIQILKRRKDNPGLSKDVKLIDTLYCYSEGDLLAMQDKIIEKCQLNNARAYLWLNRRDLAEVAMLTLKKIADLMLNKDFKAAKNAYHSACGSSNAETLKKWIVDVDTHSRDEIDSIISFINNLEPVTDASRILSEIPTKNGVHLITNPFRLDIFKKKFPEIDLHKDNPTILYIP